MGMYTQLHLDLELKQDTPQEIIDTLIDMGNDDCEKDTRTKENNT